MEIDNSQLTAFLKCPAFYYEKYVQGIEVDWDKFATDTIPPLKFGKRMHELLEEHYAAREPHPPSPNARLEDEAQVMIAAYKAFYPVEQFEVVETEKVFRMPLVVTGDGTLHWYVGKRDMVVRDKATGMLQVFETKTEKRNSKNNFPEAWAANTQATLYLWAAEQAYAEPFKNLLLNVCTRQSEKGREPPTFRRDEIERSEQQKQEAIETLCWVVDQIEQCRTKFGTEHVWPRNCAQCVQWGWSCDFYPLHILGRSESALLKYRPTEKYLGL